MRYSKEVIDKDKREVSERSRGSILEKREKGGSEPEDRDNLGKSGRALRLEVI